MSPRKRSRRFFLQFLALGLPGVAVAGSDKARSTPLLTKAIPSSGEQIPVIGLGSSRTFNVGDDPRGLDNVTNVMRHFFASGGSLIDSSPMYGSSQPAIGYGLNQLGLSGQGKAKQVFSADKVWTLGVEDGEQQMEQSRRHWGVASFDLMQIHNLVDWEEHIETLRRMKQQGQIRYTGITTSHGRQHDELATILRSHDLDFVQFSYNVIDREVERNLLPIAMERGIAVIINRAFQRGDLIDALAGQPLPGWADEVQCDSWPQLLLKFVVSHPGVTCTIPATSQVAHVKENMQASYGTLPDQVMRKHLIDYVESII